MFSKDATMNSLKQKALYKIRSEHESPDDSFKIPVLQEEDDFEDIEKVYKNVKDITNLIQDYYQGQN